MDLLPTPEQEEIVSSVGALLKAELPMPRLRELHGEEVSIDDGVWRRCAELGWFGLGLAEADGGVGYGLVEEALLFREIGRHLAPGPFVATVLAARLARGPERDAILAGSARVALLELRDGTISPDGVDGEGHVLDPGGAELALVAGPTGAALVELGRLTGFERGSGFDPSTPVGAARADGVVPVAHVAAADDPIFSRGAVLVAAMLSGIAEATRDLSAEYASSRVQFGRPIGANQAVKHACTDMAVRAEASAMQTFVAAMTLDDQRADSAFQVASAKAVSSDAALANARATIQVFGGIGFTWEADAHLYLTRAHVLEQEFGSRRHHLAALIDLPAAQ